MPLASIIQANPGINPNLLAPGQSIEIPGYPDPDTIPYRIEVSINNRQLKLFRNNVLQKQYPVAVGRMLHDTPVGSFIIINKAPNPGGPYGTMWMGLSKEHSASTAPMIPLPSARPFPGAASACTTAM